MGSAVLDRMLDGKAKPVCAVEICARYGAQSPICRLTVKVDSCEVNTMPLQVIYPACKVTRSQVEQRVGPNIASPVPGLRALTRPALCRGTRKLRSRSTRPIGASVSVTQNQSRIYGKAARGIRKFASRRGAAVSSSSSRSDSNIRVKGAVQWANFLRLLARAAKRKGE